MKRSQPTTLDRQTIWNELVDLFEQQMKDKRETACFFEATNQQTLKFQAALLNPPSFTADETQAHKMLDQVVKDLEPLWWSRHLQINIDRFGQSSGVSFGGREESGTVRKETLYSLYWCSLLYVVTTAPDATEVELSIGNGENNIEIEFSNDSQLPLQPRDHSIVQHIHLLTESMLAGGSASVLRCPQGGVAVQLSLPRAATIKMAA